MVVGVKKNCKAILVIVAAGRQFIMQSRIQEEKI